MQNDKQTNEKTKSLSELQREIEKQKAIIAAKERGASAEEIEKLEAVDASAKAVSEKASSASVEPKKATPIQKIGKIIYMAFTVILALILFVNVSLIVSRNVFKNPNPTFLGIGYFVVETASMDGDKPDSIKPWTLVFTVKQKSYEVDDIITYEGENVSSVTHRIVSINEDGTYLTRGDANNSDDTENIPQSAVAGKVFMRIEGFGKFVNLLKSPLGLLGLSCVSLGFFGVPYLFGYYDEEEE